VVRIEMEMQKTKDERDALEAEMKDKEEKIREEFMCPVCLDLLVNGVTLQCGHACCRECLYACIRKDADVTRESPCPSSRQPIAYRFEPISCRASINAIEHLLSSDEKLILAHRKAQAAEKGKIAKKQADVLRATIEAVRQDARRKNQFLP